MSQVAINKTVMENIFGRTRAEVLNSYPSIFSKDDVIALLNVLQARLLEEKEENEDYSKNKIEDLQNSVLKIIENFDFDDITEVELYNREITLDFDVAELVNEIDKEFDEFIKKGS
jgi:DNA-directed RNA polymerase beta' subunit